MFLGVFALARAQYGLAHAYAEWAVVVASENSQTLGLDDISSLMAKAAPHADASRGVEGLITILPRLRYVLLPLQPGTSGTPSRSRDHTRAPPTA